MNSKMNKKKAYKVNYSNSKLLQSIDVTSIPVTNNIEAGMIYYKRMIENLEKEKSLFEERLQNVLNLNRTQKESIMTIEKEKQKIITEFQELFRKFHLKTEYENILEERLQNIKEYLENVISSEKDVQYLGSQEIAGVCGHYLNTLQENCSTLQEIQNFYQEENEHIKKIEKEKYSKEIIDEDCNSEIENCMKIYQEKLDNLRKLIQNTAIFCEQLKVDIDTIVNQAEIVGNRTKHEIKKKLIESKANINSLRLQIHVSKERKGSEISRQQSVINKLKNKLEKKITVSSEINVSIEHENESISTLHKENESSQIQLKEILKNIQIREQEIASKNNFLNQRNTEILPLLNEIQKDVEKNELLKQQIESAKKLKEKLQEKFEETKNQSLNEEKTLAALEEKLKSAKELFNSEKEKNSHLKQSVMELQHKSGNHKKQIDNLEIQWHTEERVRNELKRFTHAELKTDENSEEFSMLKLYLAIENEQQTSDKLKESELNDLYNKVCHYGTEMQNLVTLIDNMTEEIHSNDQEMRNKEEILNKIKEDYTFYSNSVQVLKQNVHQGKYITLQELNKKIGVLTNAAKLEQEKIQKFEAEIKSMNDVSTTNTKKVQYFENSRKVKTSLASSNKGLKPITKLNKEPDKPTSDFLYSPREDIYIFD